MYCEHCDTDIDAFDKGCPACIQVPRWYEDNEHLSKARAEQLLNRINEVISSFEPQIYYSDEFKRRNEGELTSIGTMSRTSGGEIAEEDMKYGVLTFSKGSAISLRSGQKGVIIGSRFDNGVVIYEVEMEDGRKINIKNLGNNLTLVNGQQSLMYLNCGKEGIGQGEFLCPVCGATLA